MNSNRFIFRLLMLEVCLLPQAGYPCTTFCLDKAGQLVFGRNYDWMVDDGLVIVNKRGVTKSSLPALEQTLGQPARWTSKYGSITFNQYGREFPCGGMNEAGLVVESMLLEGSGCPDPDSRPYINFMQWKQYQLDNAGSVEEVLASNDSIRIENSRLGTAAIHYLVCDRKGNAAVIEFLEGNMVHYAGERMPVKALTNITYKELVDSWKGGKTPANDLGRSVERFSTVADMLERYDTRTAGSAVDYAFAILGKVAATGPMATEWSIVYDIRNLRIYFRTLENQEMRRIDVKHFDFSCTKPVKVFDLQDDQSGDVTKKFIDYTQAINNRLVDSAFKETVWTWFTLTGDNKTISSSANDIPENLITIISQYPESTRCMDN